MKPFRLGIAFYALAALSNTVSAQEIDQAFGHHPPSGLIPALIEAAEKAAADPTYVPEPSPLEALKAHAAATQLEFFDDLIVAVPETIPGSCMSHRLSRNGQSCSVEVPMPCEQWNSQDLYWHGYSGDELVAIFGGYCLEPLPSPSGAFDPVGGRWGFPFWGIPAYAGAMDGANASDPDLEYFPPFSALDPLPTALPPETD